MLKHKRIDVLCIAVMVVGVIITVMLMHGDALGIPAASSVPGYEKRLFDDTKVHTIDIVIDDWEQFLETAPDEIYTACTLVIDGESFSHVAIRAKGNNSRRLTEKYRHDRYSLKLEFDHYVHQTYYGLDKFSLDSSFQDNSYMKTYLAFDMMRFMEVATPLCSYVNVSVNGEAWGLFLAVEEPEDAFAERNFGKNHGNLYKPDYRSLQAENADVALRYTGDDPVNYDNIFRNAKFDTEPADQKRLIQSLEILSTGENLEEAVDVDAVLRYFVPQVFVVNLDSYLGATGHNYFLYEEEGILQMIPWDYNLAYATYSLGMPNPINDAERYVNYPIDTPASGDIMRNRPMYHQLMLNKTYFQQYRAYFDQFISAYFESGRFERLIDETDTMIAEYVEDDPTAFCSYADYQQGVYTIEQFCLLRAESVRKQLSGEIPSNIAGQNRDKSGFVDASGIWIPDMGEVEDLKNGVK